MEVGKINPGGFGRSTETGANQSSTNPLSRWTREMDHFPVFEVADKSRKIAPHPIYISKMAAGWTNHNQPAALLSANRVKS